MNHPENTSGKPKKSKGTVISRMMLQGIAFTIFFFILLVTAQSTNVSAQPIAAATPFEQLAQPQPQQPSSTAAATAKPGTILLTTFPNGTSKAQFVNGTTIQVLNGVGYLVLDPSASAAASASTSAPVSNTIVNRIYQAIAIAIGITINNTIPPPPSLPPQPNQTEPEGPDQDCLFDPSLPKCTPGPEGCPESFGSNEDAQCFPLGGCPDGYHSVEDDESETCYPDDVPCPDGQVRSEEGNYCIVPPEPEPNLCDQAFVPEAIPPECVPPPEQLQQEEQPLPPSEPVDDNADGQPTPSPGEGENDNGDGGDTNENGDNPDDTNNDEESSDSDDEPESGDESDGGSDGDNGNEEDAEE